MSVDRLKHLESRIDEMLAHSTAVCEERDRLRQQLASAQARIDEMAVQIRQHEAERAEVKAHVERIMGRLDGLDLS
jgi:septal ring factor EnvC (AmiA/AmiB activator)